MILFKKELFHFKHTQYFIVYELSESRFYICYFVDMNQMLTNAKNCSLFGSEDKTSLFFHLVFSCLAFLTFTFKWNRWLPLKPIKTDQSKKSRSNSWVSQIRIPKMKKNCFKFCFVLLICCFFLLFYYILLLLSPILFSVFSFLQSNLVFILTFIYV